MLWQALFLEQNFIFFTHATRQVEFSWNHFVDV
jgi:hypothetical protein